MNPTKGYFSIVQYCPDLARREAVNIGVVLVVPDRLFLDTKLVTTNKRVKRFFGTKGDDANLLTEFKNSFVSRIDAEQLRIDSLESFEKFVDTRGNQIQLTKPAFVKVRDCRETLQHLFEKLVSGKDSKRKKRESFKDSLQKLFEKGNVAHLIEKDILLPVPGLNIDAKVPYAYLNCAFHALHPVDFALDNEGMKFTRASKYSMEGKFLQSQSNDEYGEINVEVIGRFASDADPSIAAVRKVLDESNVKLRLESELPELIDEIRRTGRERKK